MIDLSSNARRVHRVGGFSLIEMMVAIAIGIILSLGLVRVMVAGKTAAQATQGANFMQENARFAMSQLEYSIQMANHLGPAKPTSASHSAGAGTATAGQLSTSLAAGNCANVLTGTYNGSDGKDPEAFWTLGIVGLDGGAPTNPQSVLGTACIPDWVSGTDVIVLRYADSNFLPCTGSCTLAPTPPYANGLVVRVAVGGNAILMTGTEATAANLAASPLYGSKYAQSPTGNQDGLYTFPYRLEIYYVRQCSNPVTAAACGATADNGNPIPSLWRRRLADNGTLLLEPVVEGIEMLHFEYALAADYVVGSGISARFNGVQTYESSVQVGGPTSDDWVGITAVRVGIMAQGDSFNSSGTRGNVAQQSLQGAWNMGSNPGTAAAFTPSYPSLTQAALLQHTIYTALGNLRNQNRG